MSKKTFIALLAALLLLSATACNNGNNPDETTAGETDTTTDESYIDVPGTDENGNTLVPDDGQDTTAEPADTTFDPSENAPTFTDCSKEIVVIAGVATVRTGTTISEENAVGWPSEGRVFTVTGESDNWYRITYKVNDADTTCYIAKTVAADASVLEGFTEVNDEVVVTVNSVNVRSYPSAQSDLSIRGSLKKDAKVTRIAKSETWSKILYEVVSETETDAEGNPVKVQKEYYVSNDCVAVVTENEG